MIEGEMLNLPILVFPCPWVVSSYVCNDQYSVEYLRAPSFTSTVFFLYLTLSSLVLYSMNSSHLLTDT